MIKLFGKKRKKTTKKKSKKKIGRNIIRVVLLKVRNALLVLTFILLPIFLIYYSYTIFSIEFSQLGRGLPSPEWDLDSRLSLVFIGGDEQENGYVFIDFLALVQIDPVNREVVIFNINPLFTIDYWSDDKFVTIKNSLAIYKNNDENKGLEELIFGVQALTANKIDGYVFVTKEGFGEVFSSLGSIKLEAPSEVADSDLPADFIIQEGENKVKGYDLIYYLSADENGENDKMKRQVLALKSFLQEFDWFRFLFKIKANCSKIEENVKTNLSLSEMLKLFYILNFQKEIDYKIGYSQSYPGYKVYTSAGEIWRPVYEDIDQDLQKIFTRNNVKLEQARVDILNSTDTAGLAKTRARWLNNRGIRVVLTGNYNEKEVPHTLIYVKQPEEYTNTLSEIASTFYGDVRILKRKYPGRSFGEIVIILGENELVKFEDDTV
ncbi:hypothetical protein GF362_00185 [Candidatus Dojkabacteria bacterium]|nr:hypothetical protein [Candidatus Dojkabacteria bacterium]